MRTPEILLSVLFPILIAVGIALGMDATGHTEFSWARAAMGSAALIAIVLLMVWYRNEEPTLKSGITVSAVAAIVLAAWCVAVTWIDMKENIICYVLAGPAENGGYEFIAWSSGPYPSLNVRISISQPGGNFVSEPEIFDVGDVEPLPARRLLQIPKLHDPGTYKIRIQTRAGYFLETFSISPGKITLLDMNRVIFNKDSSSVLIPLR